MNSSYYRTGMSVVFTDKRFSHFYLKVSKVINVGRGEVECLYDDGQRCHHAFNQVRPYTKTSHADVIKILNKELK